MNNQTGEGPHFPAFYEQIHSVLGCRDVATLPEVKEVGLDTKRKMQRDIIGDEDDVESEDVENGKVEKGI